MAQCVKQQYVYAAAASMSDLRCGDQVDVEWDGEWFAGVVTDVPTPNDLAVSYTNGDFEDSVPKNVARLRSFPKRVLPGDEKKGKRKDPQTKLRNGANSGDIGLVMEALREGANPRLMDEIGYLPLHWAAGPDEGMPGDTISRRACIALLARLSDKDACDRTSHGMRGVQHAVARNLVGCVKTFHHVGADMQSTVHWAVSQKAHGVLRELLRLGVPINTNKLEWDGCSPLMLAASGNDTYGTRERERVRELPSRATPDARWRARGAIEAARALRAHHSFAFSLCAAASEPLALQSPALGLLPAALLPAALLPAALRPAALRPARAPRSPALAALLARRNPALSRPRTQPTRGGLRAEHAP